jgi:hypothetical protein
MRNKDFYDYSIFLVCSTFNRMAVVNVLLVQKAGTFLFIIKSETIKIIMFSTIFFERTFHFQSFQVYSTLFHSSFSLPEAECSKNKNKVEEDKSLFSAYLKRM